MAEPRASCSLDGEWRFIPDPEGRHAPDSLPEGVPIRVPGPWEAQVAEPYGIVTAWYRRSIVVPADWAGQRIVVRFGAVMYRCTVYLNGERVGEHEGGYLPFEVDVTGAAVPGDTSDLAVRVVNPLNALDDYPVFPEAEQLLRIEAGGVPLSEIPHGKQTWYSSTSGLWQSVGLERRPRVALGRLLVQPDVEAGEAVVCWSIETEDGVPAPLGATIELVVRDPDGAEATRTVADPAHAGEGVARLPIPEARLWDIDQPNLYTVEARLIADGREVDRVSSRFGMRSIETRGGRILLNGRPIYVLGALDQDHYPDSIATPPSREYLDRQMRLAREMGLNLLRCHIKVPDPAYLDAADEAGILVWAELPNWIHFTPAAAARGRETLERMVEELGNHPSIVIWTIVNEDWGTRVRDEARDRRWLVETYDWLKALDPTRLVVDNSACDGAWGPNFHVKSDLADFHVYHLPPDNASQWRHRIEDFARRPGWLWSPHGDARQRGDEPLVLSEFGSWGLPRHDRLTEHHRGEPWWFGTGRAFYRPRGIGERFEAYGLGRIWPTVDDLAEATQHHQFEGLQYEIGELRRHDSVQGYVITELTDAYWEANGLLDPMRGPKVYHRRLEWLNAPTVVVADVPQRDLWGGERLRAEVTLSSYGGCVGAGRIDWALRVGDAATVRGDLEVAGWPDGGASVVGSIDAEVPDVADVTDAMLTLSAVDGRGEERARNEVRLAVVPAVARRSASTLDVAVLDPLDMWGVTDRVAGLGHRIVATDAAELVVATELTQAVVDHVDRGGRALLLVRSRAAIPEDHRLARPVGAHLRRLPHPEWPGERSPWEGDWVTSWSWILHDALPGLPPRNPLDFAYAEVLPDHVLLGYDPVRHRDEVPAATFTGWVHAPAALVWRYGQGDGVMTLTTFRVAPERGPVATLLLERLIQHAAAGSARRGGPSTGIVL